MVRLPGWLLFVIFVPLQIWLFLKMLDSWGWWRTVLTFLVLGVLGTRAARAGWLREMFFPLSAQRWERRRHVFQGILFLVAGVAWLVKWGPQPWLPLAALATLVRAALR